MTFVYDLEASIAHVGWVNSQQDCEVFDVLHMRICGRVDVW